MGFMYITQEGLKSLVVVWETSHQFRLDGLVHDCSNSIANTLELLQSCTKPSLWVLNIWYLDWPLSIVCMSQGFFLRGS